MKKVTIGIIILFSILIISALPFGYAQQFLKSYNEMADTIIIKSSNGTEMADFKLMENSEAGCEDCHALIQITPKYDMDTAAIGRFIKKFYDNKSKEINIASDMELYYIIDKKVLVDVIDYGVCSYEVNEYDNKIGKNKTRKEEYKCQTGKHAEYRTEKARETKGIDDALYAGQDYYLLIKGHKSPFESIEWIVSYAGLEMKEWAWWTGLTCAYRLPLIVTENNNTALENYPVNASVNISVAGYDSRWTRVLLEDDSNITWHNWSEKEAITFTSGKNYTLFWLTNASASSTTTNYLYLCSGASENFKAIRSYIPNSSTKGYWAMDEMGNNQTVIVDNSTSQNNGVINGSLLQVDGLYNYTALYFSGSLDNYTTIPHNISMDLNLNDYTLEMMINGTTVADYQAIFATRSTSGDDAWWIRANPTGKLECVLRKDATQISTSGAITITDSRWHHIACVRTGSTLTGYVDGKKDGSAGGANKDPDTTVSKVMGKLATAATYPFKGTLAQVRLTLGAIPPSSFVPRAIEPTISAGILGAKAVEPIIQNISIAPAIAYTNSSLNCSANYGDDDNDKGNVTIIWYNGSAHYSNVTILNVANGAFISNQTLTGIQAKGEIWNCTINATDATGLASPPNSTTRTITNLAPTIGKVSITPKPANTTNTLACSAIGYDTDLEALTMNFTWYNGSTYYNSSTFAVTDSQNKTYNLTAGLQARNELWNCSVFVNDGTANSALNSTNITIDSLFSVVSSSPTNRTNTSDNTPNFIFNYTHNSSASGNCVLYVNNSNVGSNSSVVSGKDTTITSSALNDGMNQQWWVQCTQTEKYNSTISIIGIDTIAPVISILNPNGEYFTNITPVTIPLNFSYTELNKDTCWYYLNTSNLTISSCANTTFSMSQTKNITAFVYMNDSGNNEGYNTSGFSVNLYNTSSSINIGNVTEGNNVTFTFQINSTNMTSINSTFYYNDTAYNYGTRENSSRQANFTRVLSIPYGQGNWSYYWNYTLNSFNNITEKKNITVSEIIITNCTGGGSRMLNFSYANEQTLTTGMNGSFDTTIAVWKNNKAFNRTYSFSFPSSKSAEICILPAYESYRIDLYGIFTADGYKQRTYYLANANVSNVTTNITLYHVNTTDATTVKFTVQDSTSSKLPSHYLKMYRYYPSNNNKTLMEVGKTDNSGQTLLQVVQETVDYIFEVYNYDILTWTTSKIRILCETTPCTYTVTTIEGGGVEMDLARGISYSANYNNATGYITLTFDSLDSNAKEVTLTVIRRNNTQDFLVSNQTLTQQSGILSYYIGNLTGTIIGKAYSQNELVSLYIITLYGGTSAKGIFNQDGIIWAGLLIVALALMGTWNPVASIVMAVVGVIMVSILGIATIPYYVVTMVIILAVIFILKIRT